MIEILVDCRISSSRLKFSVTMETIEMISKYIPIDPET